MMKLLRLFKNCFTQFNIPVPRLLLGVPVLTHVDLFRSRQTEPHVLRWIAESLCPGDVCFDVGAHHGWMSMVAARKVGRCGRVIAFEPAPALASYLSYIKRVNRLSQLEVVPKGVSDGNHRQRPFRIVGNGNSFMNSLLELQVPESATRISIVLDIETVTLDTFCHQTGIIPDLVKIDTEGAEFLVCEGAKCLIAAHHPTLIVATHPPWLPRGQDINDLFLFLENLGYRVVDSAVCENDGSTFGDYLLIADQMRTKAGSASSAKGCGR